MVHIVREDLWQHPGNPGMIVVSTNSTIKTNGVLVMGRGAALQAKEHIPGIDEECGAAVKKGGTSYGFLVIREPTETVAGFGIFQVKQHYSNIADVRLIESSVAKLLEYTIVHPRVRVRMNFPGIGYGRLDRDVVRPLLEKLPDSVTICYK